MGLFASLLLLFAGPTAKEFVVTVVPVGSVARSLSRLAAANPRNESISEVWHRLYRTKAPFHSFFAVNTSILVCLNGFAEKGTAELPRYGRFFVGLKNSSAAAVVAGSARKRFLFSQ